MPTTTPVSSFAWVVKTWYVRAIDVLAIWNNTTNMGVEPCKCSVV